MAVSPVILKTNPHRPVDFKESSVGKVIDTVGNVNVEIKEDGCQLNMVVEYNSEGCTVFFLSREGKMFNGLADLGAKLSADERWLKFFNPYLGSALFRDEGGFLLQAEILTFYEDGTQKPCAEISGDLRRGTPIDLATMEIVGYDLIPLDAVHKGTDYEVMQEVRTGHLAVQLAALKEFFKEIKWRSVETAPAFSLEHLAAIYEHYRTLGKEGGVAKDPQGYWKRGKKVGQWKVKPDGSCDGVVTGLIWGTPGLAYDGKVVGFKVLTEHGVEVDACNISDAQKDAFTMGVALGKPITELPEGSGVMTFKGNQMQHKMPNPFQGWTCKITYMERLPGGSYRHPSFDQFRGITDPLVKE